MGRKSVSPRRRQRRNFLKQIKKTMPASEFKELKRQFAEEGKKMRIEELRQYLEAEKEVLANKEGEMREQLKADGLTKKQIEAKIEEWYDTVKIWALHSDVEHKLV